MIEKSRLIRRRARSLSSSNRLSKPAMSPPRTTCFDIFSPDPGESDVINQVERLSSNDTKTAPRSVRMVAGLPGRDMIPCMIVSEVRVEATSLCLGVGRYLRPWDLNPVERLWLYLRERHLSHRWLDDYDAIVDACCHAGNQLTPQRIRSLCNYPYIQQVSA